MYVHKQAGLCFLASPRTASRAVRNALRQIGFKQVGDHHCGPDQGHDISGMVPFTAVRNHWDTVVSWWYNTRMNRKETQPSMAWIGGQFSKNRYYFRAGTMFWHRLVPGCVVIRYENLERELNQILTAAGLPKVELPQYGISQEREGRHYSTYYDAHTRTFVEWCFLPEVQELEYRFHEDPPWNEEKKKGREPPVKKSQVRAWVKKLD